MSAYFAPAFSYGGPPRSILGLCRALSDIGVDTRVFTTTADGESELKASPPEGDTYEGIRVRYFPLSFPRRFFAVSGLKDALSSEGASYDVVHVHGLWNVPVWTATRWARAHGVPYVLSPRGMLDRGSLAHRFVRKQIAYRLVERSNIRHAALLHATSAFERDTLRRHAGDKEVLLLPNGVDTWEGEPFVPGTTQRRLGLAEASKLVVFLGRVHPIKRLDLLARAFARVRAVDRSAHLIVAGPVECATPRRTFPDEAVHFMGEVRGEEKWSLLHDATSLVLCSESESFGLSVAEALACGVPVVVTRSCPWEDVEIYRCGYWVPDDVEALADAMKRLLSSPEEAAEMGRRGRALIEARYGWRSIAERMATAYRDVADGK